MLRDPKSVISMSSVCVSCGVAARSIPEKCCGGLTERLRSLIGNQVRCNSPVGSSPMSSARKALEILSSRAFFMASVLGTDGYSLCCPGERDLNTSIFKLFSPFFPCRSIITVIIKSCSGIIVTNIVLYGPDVNIRINKR